MVQARWRTKQDLYTFETISFILVLCLGVFPVSVMLGKAGASGFNIISRFGREIILKRSFLIPNTPTVYRPVELSKHFLRSFTRTLCNESVFGNQTTGLLNIQSSADCELKKTKEIADFWTENDIATQNASLGKEFAAQSPSSSSGRLAKGELTDNIGENKNGSSDGTCSKLTIGVQQRDINNSTTLSRFILPDDWQEKHRGSQGIKFPGKVYLIQTPQDEFRYKYVLEDLLTQKVLGFDTEYCPIKHLLCVIQIANHDTAVLWQCYNYKRKMPYYLKELLTGDVHKVGHACMDDAIMISQQFKVEPKNLVDTNFWAKDLHCSHQSLQGLCAIFLGEHLSKTHQQSNWKKKILCPGQITYAATDAWVSLTVYEEMKRQAEELNVTLTPIYKTLQQRYEEIVNSRRQKRLRRRQRIKEKKQEMKAKALEQVMNFSKEEQTTNSATVSLNHVVSDGGNVGESTESECTNSIEDSAPNTAESECTNDVLKCSTDANNAIEIEKDNATLSTQSRRRRKKFLLKFHSLE